jgi:hypothetical protein
VEFRDYLYKLGTTPHSKGFLELCLGAQSALDYFPYFKRNELTGFCETLYALVYLTILSLSQAIKYQMVGGAANSELGRMR